MLAATVGAVPALTGVMGGGTTAQAAQKHPGEEGAVYGVTAEHRTDPLGVDAAHPRFGWRMRSTGRGRSQGAYEIRVAGSPGRLGSDRADVWSSGRIRSSESVAVRYRGGPSRPPPATTGPSPSGTPRAAGSAPTPWPGSRRG